MAHASDSGNKEKCWQTNQCNSVQIKLDPDGTDISLRRNLAKTWGDLTIVKQIKKIGRQKEQLTNEQLAESAKRAAESMTNSSRRK
jgi:hypothetical protein